VRTLLFLLAFSAAAAAQTSNSVTGVILDASGAPVPNARVRLESGGTDGAGSQRVGVAIAEFRTGTDGRFEFQSTTRPSATGEGLRLVVTASGFAQATEAVPVDGGARSITLQPAAFFEAVNVTSSRTEAPRADPTSTVTVVSSTELLSSAAVTLDDALKMVPGFTLFRRTSSRTANPTAQGVALRGIAGSAQSRSLVLVDGIPLNDAFGGWVYWNKVPQVAIDRVEVQRGSGSDLYGADAVGGVVQLLTMRPGHPTGRVLLEGGNLGTGRASVFGGGGGRGWRYSAGGEWFTAAGSTHRSGLASAGYQAANGWRSQATFNVYDEDRQNGTPASINTTASRQGAVEIAGGVGGGLLSARAFGGTQQYHQTFSTVNAARTSEALNRDQRVPSTSGGLGGQWFRGWGRHTLLVGAEARYIEGKSVETPFTQGRPLATTEAGGTERHGSAFVQDTLLVDDRLTLVFGAHGDGWRSESLGTGFTKSSGSFNPRASGAYRIADGLTVRGSAYHGFRAPTLNEFYRSFSAGNVQTRPNEALGPERLTGGDVGVLVGGRRASARVTGYWNVLDEAITSVTLSATPQLIIRQRANADTLHAHGLEVEGEVRLHASLSASFASGFVSSHYRGTTDLRDKRVPQVPSYNLGTGLRFTHRGWAASTQVRVTGPQFEDDQNVYRLRRATVVDVFGSRTIAGRITAFVAAENLFDAVYDVGRTPTLTIGLPRAARAGVLIAFP
jgi:outer membrane receptor protein involved in Fe transport